jgi:hypothetical protein
MTNEQEATIELTNGELALMSGNCGYDNGCYRQDFSFNCDYRYDSCGDEWNHRRLRDNYDDCYRNDCCW